MTQHNGPHVVANRCPQCGASLPPGGSQVICEYCGSRLIRCGYDAAQPDASAPQGVAQGMHFKRFSCIDAQGLGGEALSLLIPAGWTFSGGVQWNQMCPALPATVAFQVCDPHGDAAFEVLPALPFYWTNNPMVTLTMPVGSQYFGSEVRPPAPARQVLQALVLPRCRGQAPGLRVTSVSDLPELAQRVRDASPGASPMAQVTVEAAMVRAVYQVDGRELEEDLRGAVTVHTTAAPLMMGGMQQILWCADYLFATRAAAGQLDGLADLFQTMMASLQLNPQWYTRYVQCQQGMVQNQVQQIDRIGQVSQYVSRVNDEISEGMAAAYDRQQQAYDAVATSISQAIRGVDAYEDPGQGAQVELPGGYDYAWSNGLGDYYVSDDPAFDPNRYSTANWDKMRKR